MKDYDKALMDLMPNHGEESGVRIGTLVAIRWMAIAGQITSIALVHFVLGFDLALFYIIPIILISIFLNSFLQSTHNQNDRLDEKGARRQLSFDVVHLAALLYVTGGLSNPFAVLLLAPPIISASVLGRRSTLILLVVAFSCFTIMPFSTFPLPWKGPPPILHPLYLVGIWVGLSFTMMFITLYMARIAIESRNRARALTASQIALERESKLAALGTLSAAAAHELGTPLGTITLVIQDLLSKKGHAAATTLDLELIEGEVNRCRGILKTLSAERQVMNKGENPFDFQPFEALAREAAGPHEKRGPTFFFSRREGEQPMVPRGPEIIHGLRNLIENAAGYAASRVDIFTNWTENRLEMSISDDGPGFDPQIVKRIGEPYITTREPTPGKDGGMGLGLFIAKTLLERSGGELTFGRSDMGGAKVFITWPRNKELEQSIIPQNREHNTGQGLKTNTQESP